MEIHVSLPLDSDGYIRRQCPRCARTFKWHFTEDGVEESGSTEVEVYFCPYCGEPSALDQWFTDEQVDYIQTLASNEAIKVVASNLKSSASLKLKVPDATPPAPLFELNDMVAVEPPCHPAEPLKVIDEWSEELHCLISYSLCCAARVLTFVS